MIDVRKTRRCFGKLGLVLLVAALALSGIATGTTTLQTRGPGLPVHGPPAASPGDQVEIVSTDGADNSYDPSIVVDGEGDVHVAWVDWTDYGGTGTDPDIFYKVRDATTCAWAATEVVSTESTSASLNPSITIDARGTVHVAWLDETDLGSDGTDSDIFYKTRDATTGAWSTTEVVSTESTSDSENPSIAVDATGKVHVAWDDRTDLGGEGTDWDIFYKTRDSTTGTWSTTMIMSTESTSGSYSPSIVVDRAGVVHAVWQDWSDINGSGTDLDIFYKTRDVITGAWSTTEVVSTESTGNSYDPSIAMGPNGDVHVSWVDMTNLAGSGTDVDIFSKTRRATTGTWSATKVVSTESYGDSSNPSIAVDAAGNAHVAWEDATDRDGAGTDVDIFFKTRSITTGDWSTTAVVSTESTGDSGDPSIAVDLTGNVHVTWTDVTNLAGAGTDWDVFYKVLPAVTGAWSTTVVVSTESTDPSQSPSLAVDAARNVHVAWHDLTNYDGSGTDSDIFYKTRDAITGAWSVTEVVSTESTGTSQHASLVVDAAGNVHVAWEDFTDYNGSGTDPDIFYKVRNATLNAWSTTEVVSTDSAVLSLSTSLAVDDAGNVHVAWEDSMDYGGEGTDWDIFYKVRNATTGAWSTVEIVSVESAADSRYSSLAVDAARNVHIAWQDESELGGSGTDRDIFYSIRNATTGAWSATAIVSTESTGHSYDPSLAVDPARNVHVAWYDLTNYSGSGTDLDIFYKVQNATTGVWSTTEVVSTESTGISGYQFLAVDAAGSVHVSWQDTTDLYGAGVDADIFYKCRDLFTGKWSTTAVVSTESTEDSMFASLGVDDAGTVHVAWADYTNLDGAGADIDIFYKSLSGPTVVTFSDCQPGMLVAPGTLIPFDVMLAGVQVQSVWTNWDAGIATRLAGAPYHVIAPATAGMHVLGVHYTIINGQWDAIPLAGLVDGDVVHVELFWFVVSSAVPTVTFVASEPIAGSWVAFSFTGSEGDSPATFQWSFGDGSSNSTDRNPVHEYTATGNYVVVLTVTDADGDARSSQQLIEIVEVGPKDPTGLLVAAIIIAAGGLGTAILALVLILKPRPRK